MWSTLLPRSKISDGGGCGIGRKTSRLLFKIAVELGKISNMLAAANEVDDETLRELHIMCIDEVRKINGIITYDSAAKFQRND